MTDDDNRKPFGVEWDDPMTAAEWAIIVLLGIAAIAGIVGVFLLIFLLVGIL